MPSQIISGIPYARGGSGDNTYVQVGGDAVGGMTIKNRRERKRAAKNGRKLKRAAKNGRKLKRAAKNGQKLKRATEDGRKLKRATKFP